MSDTLSYLEEEIEMDLATGIFTVNNSVSHAEGLIAHAKAILQNVTTTSVEAYHILTGQIETRIYNTLH